eukprot:11435879-Ditylum_brightwellii.AAC.1
MGVGGTSAAGGEGARSIEPTYCKIVCKKFFQRKIVVPIMVHHRRCLATILHNTTNHFSLFSPPKQSPFPNKHHACITL